MTQRYPLTEAQDAMLEHMAYLNYCENRPASWQDFASFEVNNKVYRLKYGTIRNNFSYLRRLNRIRREYRSINSYYSLEECAMTSDQAWVRPNVITATTSPTAPKNKDLTALIERMTFESPAVHDIHLRFHCPELWNKLSKSSKEAKIMPVSQDIVLPPFKSLDAAMKGLITVHRTNIAIVRIACSKKPIHLDNHGLMLLNIALGRIQERLRSEADIIIDDANDVPHPDTWTVVMWHLGRDSVQRYNGQKFHITLNDLNGELLRAYSKDRIVRIEKQDTPYIRLQKIMEEKLRTNE